jgi:hypothetical protein
LIFFFDCYFFPTFSSWLCLCHVGQQHCLLTRQGRCVYSAGTMMLWADNKPLCVCGIYRSLLFFSPSQSVYVLRRENYMPRGLLKRVPLGCSIRSLTIGPCGIFLVAAFFKILIVFFFFHGKDICSKVGVL